MNKTDTPGWLIKIQNNSWEPEIFISGLTFASLFILPTHIFNFMAMLIQDYGADYGMSFLVHTVLIFLVSSIKLLLGTHLILRGFWTGLVGLSYVFPKGANKEKLAPKYKDFIFEEPVDLVVKTEKLCSLIFSFTFLIIFFLMSIISSYIGIILINVTLYSLNFDEQTSTNIMRSLIALTLAIGLFYIIKKKKKLTSINNKSLYINIMQIFSSNIGKKKLSLLFIILALVSIPLSYHRIFSFKFYLWKKYKVEQSSIPVYDQEHYADVRNNDFRVPRATLSSFNPKDNSLQLHIANYFSDRDLVDIANNEIDAFRTITSNNDLVKAEQTDIYLFFLNDKPIKIDDWIMLKSTHHSQKMLTADIPIQNLAPGLHSFKIKRVKWSKSKQIFTLNENWITLPFKKY